MMNYSNLSDVDFEYLCQDIMARKLKIHLERFASGRDGGIDLTDDVDKKNVVIQCKHYVKTNFAGLKKSLEKEVEKVKKLNPGDYYICCSQELTAKNKAAIYSLFEDYMSSPNNVISLIDIDDFLMNPENADILRKHFKLWIESTNILSDIYNNDICIDSEVLFFDIENEAKLYVDTSVYYEALKQLEKTRALIIVGDPGVGKTITSKMLVLYYVTQGYRIRYSSDSHDLKSIKNSLSQSRETKELILLDDCLGQAYFNMKENQGNELVSLIKYINFNPNKILIMNSRVTIYRDAYVKENGFRSIEEKGYKMVMLNMNGISVLDKARIFYNHLYFCDVPKEYRDSVRANKQYLSIIKHPNYNPRIIEFVTRDYNYQNVDPSEYSKYILECLNHPDEIWKEEFENRLDRTDRELLFVLYSLTNTEIEKHILKACYDYRISNIKGIDTSVNCFENSLNRLNKSMIKVIDQFEREKISVSNPSVNDFLSSQLDINKPEKNELIRDSRSLNQLQRLLSEEEYNDYVKSLFENKDILNFVFHDEEEKQKLIATGCAEYQIKDNCYKTYIQKFIREPKHVSYFGKDWMPISGDYLLKFLLDEHTVEYYEIRDIITDLSSLKDIVSSFYELDDAVCFVNNVDKYFDENNRSEYVEVMADCLYQIIMENSVVDAGSFTFDYYDEIESGVTTVSELADIIDATVRGCEGNYIESILEKLPKDIEAAIPFDEYDLDAYGCEAVAETYFADDTDESSSDDAGNQSDDYSEIERMFER